MKKLPGKRARTTKGTTLIEVLIALTLLSVTVLVVMGLLPAMISMDRSSKGLAQATLAAQSILEYCQEEQLAFNIPVSNLADTTSAFPPATLDYNLSGGETLAAENVDSGAPGQTGGQYAVTSTVDPQNSGILDTTVTVYYYDNGQDHTVTLKGAVVLPNATPTPYPSPTPGSTPPSGSPTPTPPPTGTPTPPPTKTPTPPPTKTPTPPPTKTPTPPPTKTPTPPPSKTPTPGKGTPTPTPTPTPKKTPTPTPTPPPTKTPTPPPVKTPTPPPPPTPTPTPAPTATPTPTSTPPPHHGGA